MAYTDKDKVVSVGWKGAVYNFANDEFKKSCNLAPLENKEYSGSFSSAWASFNISLLQKFTLKAGKTYSWSAKIKSSNGCQMNKLGLTTNSQTIIDMYNLGALANEYITVSKTFTPTADIVVNSIYVHNATVGSVDVKEIMVVEGENIFDYQEWNGEINRDKQVKEKIKELAIAKPSYFIQLTKNTGANTFLEINIGELLPSNHTRFQLKIEGIQNVGVPIFSFVNVNARTSADYMSVTINNLLNQKVTATFDIETQILKISSLMNYSYFLITIMHIG